MSKLHKLQVCEQTGAYTLESPSTVLSEDDIFKIANQIVERRMRKGQPMSSPRMLMEYLKVELQESPIEQFGVIYGDVRNRIITKEILFTGTIDAAAVYPREIVRRVIELGASSVWLYHCHPSGMPEPSQNDRAITRKIRDALSPIDVRLLDHIVVGYEGSVSFAERGML
ncbi:DNA repair protein RadC [Vibrio breoganii]|uniref:RadC family protein n=1 Tax=Vibrio breoganii TaxID=553239 RepID=UPI000C81E97A|nr:DNA repair protein RadC [Vibrio breoganii]PML12653.1 hypothetical protein BCT84_01880 [Vibrio breoganii]